MKKSIVSLVILLVISLTIKAQVDGVTFKKVKPSLSLKEYEIAYFNDKVVVTGRHGVGVKTDYYNLHYMLHIFQQGFMTSDSLLSSNDIANKQKWFGEYLGRRGTNATEKDKKLQLGYEFDQKLRIFLGANLSSDLVQRFLASAPKKTTGKFTTWSGSANQFEIKKAYDDFLKSNVIAEIKKDFTSFSMANDLIYMAYGGIGAYDFDTKELLFVIRTDHLIFPETIKQNQGGTLNCMVKMSEEEAQRVIEKKHYRALIPVKPSDIEINTIIQYLTDKEPIDRRYFMTELNGNEIELIGSRDAQDKIITIDVNACITR